ncbi:MAG: SDR family oxidoreductase [Candidatus Omnitrophica bacterium]|nr:SDR family oxidoreductase [Candidatus Omnitrophota bacterium]
MKLAGKIALITGAGQRIGREIARTLASEGAAIVIHYLQSRREAESLRDEIEALGSQTYLVPADFNPKKKSLVSTIQKFVREVYKKAGRVDILVNNASNFYPTQFGKISEKDWDDFHAVNLKAPFFLAQEIGKHMLKQKSGKIINIADWAALRPSPRFLPYMIAKGGLITATQGLAKVLAPHVQVNAILPGPILPPAGGMSSAAKKTAADKTLLKRFGTPKDIASAVEFLATSEYITGALIPVEGGALIA